jgi:hypothetical protein
MEDKKPINRILETRFATIKIDDEEIIHVKGKEGADVTKEDFELLDNWLKNLNLKKQIIFADRSQGYSHTFDAQKLLMQKKILLHLLCMLQLRLSWNWQKWQKMFT